MAKEWLAALRVDDLVPRRSEAALARVGPLRRAVPMLAYLDVEHRLRARVAVAWVSGLLHAGPGRRVPRGRRVRPAASSSTSRTSTSAARLRAARLAGRAGRHERRRPHARAPAPRGRQEPPVPGRHDRSTSDCTAAAPSGWPPAPCGGCPMKILFVAPWIPGSSPPAQPHHPDLLADEHDVRVPRAGARRRRGAAGRASCRSPTRSLVANPRCGRARAQRRRAADRPARCRPATPIPRGLRATLRPQLARSAPGRRAPQRVPHRPPGRGVRRHSGPDRPRRVPQRVLRTAAQRPGRTRLWRALGRVERRRMRASEDELVARRVPLIVSAPADDRRPARTWSAAPATSRVAPAAPARTPAGALRRPAQLRGQRGRAALVRATMLARHPRRRCRASA